MRSTILESIVKKGAEKLSDHDYPWCRFRCHRKCDASTRRAPAVVAAPAGAQEASVRDLGTRRAPMLDAALPRREQPLGLALRDLLGAEPRPLRKAIEWRSDPGEDASAGGKTAVRARALVDSLDAVARFLSDRASAPRALADEVDPVVDPLLEHVVRPSSADPPGAPVARTSDSKRSALRVVAWLLAPAPLGAGGACADRVAATLAARCAPPTPKRARLAACVALRHAAVAAPPGARWTPSDPPALMRAIADALADAERGRRTHEGVPEPPTRTARSPSPPASQPPPPQTPPRRRISPSATTSEVSGTPSRRSSPSSAPRVRGGLRRTARRSSPSTRSRGDSTR